jgi:hypothetical protein
MPHKVYLPFYYTFFRFVIGPLETEFRAYSRELSVWWKVIPIENTEGYWTSVERMNAVK